jgi:hypothetical protein
MSDTIVVQDSFYAILMAPLKTHIPDKYAFLHFKTPLYSVT